jgi:hypothetical protein
MFLFVNDWVHGQRCKNMLSNISSHACALLVFYHMKEPMTENACISVEPALRCTEHGEAPEACSERERAIPGNIMRFLVPHRYLTGMWTSLYIAICQLYYTEPNEWKTQRKTGPRDPRISRTI